MADNYVDYTDLEAVKLQKAILSLPAKQQAAFNLRYYDELSYEEIAEATGSTPSALHSPYSINDKKNTIMNKEFDFDKMGKRVPYTTPDGFFDKLEEDIWKEVKDDYLGSTPEKEVLPMTAEESKAKKPHRLRIAMRCVLALAASVVIAFIINMNFTKQDTATINDVDQAFSQLTTDDQAYLLNIYQDDVFINE